MLSKEETRNRVLGGHLKMVGTLIESEEYKLSNEEREKIIDLINQITFSQQKQETRDEEER